MKENEYHDYPDIETMMVLRKQIEKKKSALDKLVKERGDILRKKVEETPACKLLCLKCIELYPGFAHIETTAQEGFISWEGSVHGGITAAVIDTAMGAAVETVKSFDDRIATVNLEIDYLSPVNKNECICAKAWLTDVSLAENGGLKIKSNQKKLLHVECAVVAKPLCVWAVKPEPDTENKPSRRIVAKASSWFMVFGKRKGK